ncbi:MAG: DNA-protecting protein DprA [Nocardioidaceae bacterium]|nr:DNA-protecting protein DprA [Nocardioidaceae bacterium]
MTGRSLDPVRRARLVLSRIGEPGDPRLTGLVSELGPLAVLDSLRSQPEQVDLREALADRLAAADPEADLRRAARAGIRFVTPEDDEWPDGLVDLAHAPVLHERGGSPVGLWVRGRLRLDEAVAGAVAVVGSRSATTYGADAAAEIGSVLGDRRRPVVSGAAFGIDQAAHRGALAARGITVAVLACGADRAYPSAHAALLDYIADVGLVISEAAPGCSPTRVRFLARNRIIAALGAGTVVVEAATRSGALNTAQWAAGMSRVLMGVPGPVTSAQSEGVHRLIRSRDGLLVTSGRDVLEAVGSAGEHLVSQDGLPSRPRDRLGFEHRVVLEAVPRRSAATSRSIARAAGLAPARVTTILEDLSRGGFVERSRDRWRQVASVLGG